MAKSGNRAPGSGGNSGYKTINPTRMPRSAFDLSYSHKTTGYPAKLLPLYKQEVMPGDTITWRPSFMVRKVSTIFPYMDGLRLEYQVFFTPARLVWDNWAKMHGERLNPADHNDYTVPQMTVSPGGTQPLKMLDYLGVPTEVPNLSVSSLWARSLSFIWNEWYRDQNLQDSMDFPTDDGPDSEDDAWFDGFTFGKPKDRFAGALPFAQKGDPVSLPLGSTAPVEANGPIAFTAASGPSSNVWQTGSFNTSGFTTNWNATPEDLTYVSGLQVDLQSATAATINEIRVAVSLQHMFERDARGGTRYSEQIYSHFGVQMPDVRYRPELLCVGSMDIYPNEVPQTSETTAESPQGTLASYARGRGVGRGFTKSFDEWGFIIGFVRLRADVSWSQGVPADMIRLTRVDHYTPDLALIGEEAIPSIEIYADGTGDRDQGTGDWQPWGFTPRYESYRHRVNMISGYFRSNGAAALDRLDRWHFGIDLASRPVLNADFIRDDPQPILRNSADGITTVPFLIDCHWKVTGVRPMPKVGVPGLIRF